MATRKAKAVAAEPEAAQTSAEAAAVVAAQVPGEAAGEARERLVWLRVDDVIPTLDNPRRVRADDPRTVELAESIRAKGLLQPVVVREHPLRPGKFDLRAGERRWLAHVLLGRETILARVLRMDNAEALEATVLENLQRLDLSPLEEARGVQSLLGSGRGAAEVGAQIGKSARWVRSRAQLVDLAEPWQTWFESQTMPARGKATAENLALTVRHLELLAAFPMEVQERLARACEREPWRLMAGHWSQFQDWVQAQQGRLMAAPWDLDSVFLPGGACSACASRSRRRQQWLFAPEGGEAAAGPEQDVCLDRECWRRKEKAFLEGELARLRLEHPNVIEVRTAHPPYEGGKVGRLHGLPMAGKETYYEARLVKRNEPLAVPALVAYGPGVGTLVWVVLQTTRRGPAAAEESGPKTLAEKREQLALRRRARAVELFAAWLETEEARGTFGLLDLDAAYGVVLAIGCSGEKEFREAQGWKAYRKLLTQEAPEQALAVRQGGLLWDRVRPTLAKRLRVYGLGDVDGKGGEAHDAHAEMVEQCGMLGVDAVEWDAEAEAGLPEPKCWAKLEVM